MVIDDKLNVYNEQGENITYSLVPVSRHRKLKSIFKDKKTKHIGKNVLKEMIDSKKNVQEVLQINGIWIS